MQTSLPNQRVRTRLATPLFRWVACCMWVLASVGPARADGNPDIVGVLAVLTDAQVAAELELSDEQMERLQGMVKQHEANALEIAAELRSLDLAQRRERSKQILRALESDAMALLNESQRARAEQLRLQQVGVAAVLEQEVATVLGVSEAQLAKIQTLMEGRRGIFREFGPERGEREWKRQMEEILDEPQRAKWREMTGSPIASSGPAAAGEVTSNELEAAASSPSDRSLADAAAMPSAALGGLDMLPTGERGLRMNFNSVPWSDVLKWLAKEAELSLQTDFYPPGTFTYRDPYRVYSVADAMDIMNSVMLSRGYTLVRRQRALMCVDLGSGDAEVVRGLIRELAELVPSEQLDQRGEYEMCKSVFTMQRLSVEEAEKEVKQLLGPQGSIVPMINAGQLLVTETGGKLRIIRDTLMRSEMPESSRTAKIVSLPLKNMSAEEVLGIARPLLGLKDSNNVSDDLSVSTDAFGATLFATGTPDKLQKLRDIVLQVDVAPADTAATTSSTEQPLVKSHPVLGSDPQTTMDVLQTQFAGQTNINMALDPKSNNIIARATPTDHKIIDEIIATLAGELSEFQVIELDKIDTQAAILTLEKFFGKQSSREKDAAAGSGPIFYGDTITRRIMVRGTKQEVEQVRSLLNKVQESGPTLDGLRNNARFLPYSGKSADRILDQIDLLWEATNHKGRIRKIEPREPTPPKDAPPKASKSKAEDSAVIVPALQQHVAVAIDPPESAVRLAKSETYLELEQDIPVRAESKESQPSEKDEQPAKPVSDELKIYRGPTGLIVTSDDPQLLNEFDEIARLVQEQMASGPSEPTVIYLKYITAPAAEELIRGVLGGASSSSSGGGAGLLGDVASSVLGGGGFLGSLLGMGGGGGGSVSSSSMTASGDVSITADPRLNALWVQANPLDMQLIEQLVEIIDTPNSPIEVQTRGTPRIIYLETAAVDQVEATVKAVFADRLASSASAAAQRPPSPQEFIEALRGGGGGGGRNRQSAPKELKEQTMSITADKKNNALIVMAPKQLYDEVAALVSELDTRAEGSEDSVVVLPLGGEINPTTIRSALSSVFGTQARTTTSSNTQPNTQPNTNQPAPQAGFNPQQFRGFNPGAFGGQGGQRGGNPFGGGGGGNPFGGGGIQGFQGFQGNRGGQPFGGNQGGGGGGQGGGNRGGGNRGGR